MRKIRFQPVVVSMMVIALFTGCTSIRKRLVGLPGSPPAEGSRAVTDGGIKISGWSGKVDAAEQKAGMSISDARLAEETGAFHITTGPAVSYWKTGSIVTGNYTVTATFNEPRFMNLNSHPHPYGVFIGGNDMGTSSPDRVLLWRVWRWEIHSAWVWASTVPTKRSLWREKSSHP